MAKGGDLVYGLLQALKQNNKIRAYHTSHRLYNLNDKITGSSSLFSDAIKELYKDRVAPVKVFDKNNILDTCFNFLNFKERTLFLQKWGDKGGIYLIQFKFDPNVYYIGRTNKFNVRLKSHIKHNLSDRFHVFAKLVGWENFEFSIVEECSLEKQGARENWYLQEYLPLLNTSFVSNHSESIIFNSLYDILKTKRFEAELPNNPYEGISIYVYKYSDTFIDNTPENWNSVYKASKKTGISRASINMYLNTNVPYRGLLFYTNPIQNFESTYDLVKNATKDLKLDHNIAKEVWVYSSSPEGDIQGQSFPSREKVAKFLNISTNLVRYHIDNWKPGGINGNYLFSKQLTENELQDLIELSFQ